MNDSGIRALWAWAAPKPNTSADILGDLSVLRLSHFHPWPQRYLLYLTSCNSLISPNFPTVHPQAGIPTPYRNLCGRSPFFKTTQLPLLFVEASPLGGRKLGCILCPQTLEMHFQTNQVHHPISLIHSLVVRDEDWGRTTFLSSSSHPYCSQVMQMIKTLVEANTMNLTNFLKRSIFWEHILLMRATYFLDSREKY